MRPSAHLQTVATLLSTFASTQKALDSFLDTYYRNHRYMGSKDRRTVTHTLYTIIRNRSLIDYMLKTHGKCNSITARERLIGYLILVKKTPADSLGTLFDDSPYGLSSLSKSEQLLIKALYDVDRVNASVPDTIHMNTPLWLQDANLYSPVYRQDIVRQLLCLNDEAPADIRVNLATTTVDHMLSVLSSLNIKAERLPYALGGLRLDGRPALKNLQEFKEGYFEFQDEGSQLIAPLIASHNPQLTLDYCAGAGGKTLHLASLLKGKGRITATDIDAVRLQEAKKRARRAGITSIAFASFSKRSDDTLAFKERTFDAVLVDAPCTGSGTWRRNPELKWRLEPVHITEMAQLQTKVITEAARFVKSGGALLYVTCSLFYEENERVVEEFLKNHPNFALHCLKKQTDELYNKPLPFIGPYLHLSPNSTGTDGFFAAYLKRID